MATIERQPAGKKPVSSHRLFPAIVALWFAALFGVGSLVLPTPLIERVAVASGLAGMVAAAQPPLGVTAKLLIALVGSGFGIVLGIFIARKIAASQRSLSGVKSPPSVRATDRHPDAPARRPISAPDELGDELGHELGEQPGEDRGASRPPAAVVEPARLPGRRRALSLNNEESRSEYLDVAPLPGHNYAEEALPDMSGFAPEASPEPEPEPEHGYDWDDTAEAGIEPLELGDFSVEPGERFTAGALPLETPLDAQPDVSAAPPQDEPSGNEPLACKPLADLNIVELVERLGMSIRHYHEAGAAPPQQSAQAFPREAEPAPPARLPDALRTLDFHDRDDGDDCDDCDDAPEGAEDFIPAASLKMPQMPQIPLDAAIHRAAPEAANAEPKQMFVPAAAAEAEAPSRFPLPAEPIVEDADSPQIEDEAESEDESTYSSLLAMRNPFMDGAEPFRIEEFEDPDEMDGSVQPMVIFPGGSENVRHRARDNAKEATAENSGEAESSDARFAAAATQIRTALPDFGAAGDQKNSATQDTEEALREALSTLRRMSGAA
ncbi:hypothetical protein [Altererythrobacter aquiaggeris]|uniref:hypothetical protein n=1 Tax=Aestuarierythrobacter aquiaggeris TaxID=1898396 RepID=UPI003016C2AD